MRIAGYTVTGLTNLQWDLYREFYPTPNTQHPNDSRPRTSTTRSLSTQESEPSRPPSSSIIHGDRYSLFPSSPILNIVAGLSPGADAFCLPLINDGMLRCTSFCVLDCGKLCESGCAARTSVCSFVGLMYGFEAVGVCD